MVLIQLVKPCWTLPDFQVNNIPFANDRRNFGLELVPFTVF
jgi:hypothetical protein